MILQKMSRVMYKQNIQWRHPHNNILYGCDDCVLNLKSLTVWTFNIVCINI
jgi:hypothetical protein